MTIETETTQMHEKFVHKICVSNKLYFTLPDIQSSLKFIFYWCHNDCILYDDCMCVFVESIAKREMLIFYLHHQNLCVSVWWEIVQKQIAIVWAFTIISLKKNEEKEKSAKHKKKPFHIIANCMCIFYIMKKIKLK